MSMQLFSFGHPCEHQLHRACIGGLNCPLNGYPDTWCCSFIKGKINFKRDRPCEGPRCFWDYVHPSQSQFDEVTQVLEQGRPIAAKLDEASDTDLLSFHISNPHIIDTVQCALHMMRHPPSVCARRVGQLLAYAAVLAGEQDVFVQLLKTMKKPVDGYILGAYAFLTQSKGGTAGGAGRGGSGAGRGGSGAKKSNKKKDGKDDITLTLANIVVELMNAALSLGGQLVDREDQHVLQAMLIKALSTYPKSDKRHQDMLEKAIAKFGHRRLEEEEEAAVEREAAKRETASAAAVSTAAAPPPTTKQDTAEPCAIPVVAATAGFGGATSAVAVGSSSVEPTTGEEATTATALRGPATTTATVTVTADAAAVLAVQAPAGAPRFASRINAAAAAASAAPGAAADATVKAAVTTRPPVAGEDVVVMATGAGSVATAHIVSTATPKPAASSVPETPAVIAADSAAVAPLTFSTAIQVQQPAAVAVPACSPAGQGISTGAPGAQATAAAATLTASPPAPARTATVGISKLQPYLAARAASMRDELPGVPPIYSPKSHSSGLFICGGQFTVEPLVWNCAPLGDAAANRHLDTPTREYMRMKDENRQRQRAARDAHQAYLAAIEVGNPLFTSERLPRIFSTKRDDSSDSWAFEDNESESSSSGFSFD